MKKHLLFNKSEFKDSQGNIYYRDDDGSWVEYDRKEHKDIYDDYGYDDYEYGY